jgi:hypothetical protein
LDGESAAVGNVHTVDLHLAVGDNRLDHALLLEVGKALAGQRAVDLHAVDEGSDGDEAVRLDILVELLRGGLVEQDGVLCLVLDLALRPLLLLLLASGSGRLNDTKKIRLVPSICSSFSCVGRAKP